MRTLRVFGDSFTEGHKLDLTFPWYRVWEKYRGGNLPDTWHEILSKKINYDCKVTAIGGSSNVETFHTICKECSNFEKDDIIIINWSYMTRFRWASDLRKPNGEFSYYLNEKIPFWKRLGPSDLEEDYYYISKSTKEEIVVNKSSYDLYIDEIYDYEKIIDKLCESIGCTVYYWSMDNKVINSLPKEILSQKKYICNQYVGNYETEGLGFNIGHHCTLFNEVYKRGGKNIQRETDFEIPDTHLGESGHRIQAEMFYEYLIQYHNFQ